MIKKFEEYVYDIDRVFIKPLIMNDWSELDEHETEMLTKWLDQDHFLHGHWSFDPYLSRNLKFIDTFTFSSKTNSYNRY